MQIELRNLSKSYHRGQTALRNLNLTLGGPCLLGLVGPNGAGKSTLMKLLTAAILPSIGEILVDGQPLLRQEQRLKSMLGYLPQEFGLFEDLTAVQFLDYMAALKAMERQSVQAEIERVLTLVHLQDKAKAKLRTLSGGQKQRVGIAQALLGNPQLLILDEPTAGLDPAERLAFRNLFSQAGRSKLVILSTHIIEDVQSACSQLVVLNHGEILYAGTPEQLMQAKSVASLEAAYMALMEGGRARE